MAVIHGGRISTVNNTESIEITKEEVFLRGKAVEYEIDMTNYDGYRISVAQGWEGRAHLEIRQINALGDKYNTGTPYSEPILKTLGYAEVIYGLTNNNPSFAGQVIWTEIIKPLKQKEIIRVIHNNSSPSDEVGLTIEVTKYKSATEEKGHSKSLDIFEYRRNESIEPGKNFPELDSSEALVYDYPIQIDHLEWQTNHRTMPRIYIEIKAGGKWVPITRVVSRDGSSAYVHTPERIQKLKSGMWEVLEFDNESNDRFFKFSLRKSLIASEGVRIYIKNDSEEKSYAGAIVIKGRKI